MKALSPRKKGGKMSCKGEHHWNQHWFHDVHEEGKEDRSYGPYETEQECRERKGRMQEQYKEHGFNATFSEPYNREDWKPVWLR